MNLAKVLKSGGILLSLGVVLMGCEEGALPQFGKKTAEFEVTSEDGSTTMIERDVEAPDVFQANEAALWDGRPSLGGVWVTYPGDIDPERVIIRNEANNKFVIGALFQREREQAGPAIQLSSEAAAALGVVAGRETVLNVTALRREQVPDENAVVEGAGAEEISEQPLGPIAAAAAAIDEADANLAQAEKPKAAPKPVVKTSGLKRPYIQIGIFSVKSNATTTAANLRKQGIEPTVKAQESQGKKFWRVLAGPATSSAELAALLKKIKGIGFTDAYAVTN